MIVMTNKIQEDIAAAIEGRPRSDRQYLGGSYIGHECVRRLYYHFRHASKEDFDWRLLKIFETGNVEEDRMIADLRRAGYRVADKAKDGRQFKAETLNGWIAGHLDGFIEIDDEPYVLELKTHSLNSFTRLESKGVKKSKPVHYSQMQFYMGMSAKHLEKWGLDKPVHKALYMAKCKNDERLYFEFIDYDHAHYVDICKRGIAAVMWGDIFIKCLDGDDINFTNTIPPRIQNNPDRAPCKITYRSKETGELDSFTCEFYGVCYEHQDVDESCKTCAHFVPSKPGQSHCEEKDRQYDFTRCNDYKLIPGMTVLTRLDESTIPHEKYTDLVDMLLAKENK